MVNREKKIIAKDIKFYGLTNCDSLIINQRPISFVLILKKVFDLFLSQLCNLKGQISLVLKDIENY